jgi:chromosome partitioning protein
MKVISVIALKGGVGKTVTAVNLAALFSSCFGKRVVVMDVDPQGNSTRFFLGSAGSAEIGTYDILCGEWDPQSDPVGDFMQPAEKYELAVVPGCMDLFELDALRSMGREGGPDVHCIEQFCDRLDGLGYDYCFIDCPPGFTVGSVSAIVASDLVISPVTLDDFSFSGLINMQRQFASVFSDPMPEGKQTQLKFFLNKVDDPELKFEFLSMMENIGYRNSFLDTCVRYTKKKVAESTFVREALHTYSPWCSAARDLRALAKEVWLLTDHVQKEDTENGKT